MNVIAVPNWSFYDRVLADEARGLLQTAGLRVHYCQGDEDHRRTVTGYSGSLEAVQSGSLALARLILPHIDLRLETGVHPRVGALDVMPWVSLDGNSEQLIEPCRDWASRFSEEFSIPVYLYEMAAFAEREWRLPVLRGQLGPIDLSYDFGSKPNQRWGTTIAGVRQFLLAANINLATQNLSIAKQVAAAIRSGRDQGIAELKGVRALGFSLPTAGLVQLSLNFTQPDETSFDFIYDFANAWLKERSVSIAETELIGVIRKSDAAKATRLKIGPAQIVD